MLLYLHLLGSTLFFLDRSAPDTSKVTRIHESKGALMLPSVWFFLQLFVSHLVRMVFVAVQAPVSASLGGPAADAELVNRNTV